MRVQRRRMIAAACLVPGLMFCLLILRAPLAVVVQDRFTDQEAETLASLEQIDDYPLYTMHQSGTYRLELRSDLTAATAGFGCSLLAAMGGDSRVYGRNFDWTFSPALLLFTEPSDGYASVSMVDLAYLFPAAPLYLTELPVAERVPLLHAFSIPFDGMNEAGLAIGMAAVPWSLGPSYDPAKPDIDSIGIIREVLDHAANVTEAISIFESSNVRTTAGPPIHYLLADRSGSTAVVEFYEGELAVLWSEVPWHLATNFLCADQWPSVFGQCPRYDRLAERLEETGGVLSWLQGLDLLREVSQPGLTQWSIIYDLAAGQVYVTVGRDYEVIHLISLR